MARLAGRLVAIRAWERLGFARLSDYARERLGLGARQIRDLAHVDAALERLPAIEAALVAGALSWTKTRLLCRIATPEDEVRWLAFARRTSARALAREVRALDRGSLEAGAADAPLPDPTRTDEDGAPVEPRETVVVRCHPGVRARWWHAQQVARRVAGEHLPPWGCMEAVVGEVLSALPPEADATLATDSGDLAGGESAAPSELDAPAPTERSTPARDTRAADDRAAPATGAANGCTGEPDPAVPASDGAANGCTLLPLVDACGQGSSPDPPTDAGALPLPPAIAELLAGVEAADAFALDARLRRAVALEQRAWAELGPELAAVARGRLYRGRGFTSLEHWARERLGISPRKARALLRLERAGAACPPLRAAYREGRLSWVQAHALVPVLLLDASTPAASTRASRQAAWIAWAGCVSVRRLLEDVEHALVLADADPGAFAETGGLPARDRIGGERQTGARPSTAATPSAARAPASAECARFFFTAPADVARLVRATICTVRRRLERVVGRPVSEGEAMGAMLDHALAAWGDGARVSAAHRVFARDGWRCTVPGCSSYRNLHDHHVVFRSLGGGDELANRTTLCAHHHLRGVHAGRVRVTGRAPEGLRYELGLRPGRPPLLRYGSGDRCDRPAQSQIDVISPRNPIHVTRPSSRPE